MKKLLSVLLSAVLCASVMVTSPEMTEMPELDGDNRPGIEIEVGEDDGSAEHEAAPCDDSKGPGCGGDGL